MASREVSATDVRLRAENIGGIDQTDVTFQPGIAVLTGRNATNRTSLLQAIMAALGSSRVSLKGDADSGKVTVEIGDQEYTRTLERHGDSVRFGGDPYLEDSELADLFAFLLESNEARRTVALGEDLRDIIMEPVDADAIEADIRRLKAERDDVDDQIETLEQRKAKLPKLEERRQDLESQIEEIETELEDKQAELAELSKDADEARAEQSELEAKMEELQEKRSTLETTEFRLDSQRESRESLETEREELEGEFDEIAGEQSRDVDEIDAEIQRLRDVTQQLESELNKLQNVIQFNEEMLDGTSTDIAAALRGDDGEDVTDKLLDDGDDVVCWTCGTAVEEADIEATLDRLRELRQEKYAEQNDVTDELDELKETKSQINTTLQQRERLQQRLADVTAEIDQREAKIEELEAARDELEAEVEQIQAEIDELEAQDRSEVIEVHRAVNELELKRDRLVNERADVDEELERIESQDEEIETLQDRREQIDDELDELRTRIERIEAESIEEFNEHMDAVLEMLDYDNLERIWVERIESESRRGRRKVDTVEFRLHVVRSTDDGVTYEDDFEHLSESEREVTGLVFALAGYLAHDVHEEIPVMLLDSLEAIDSERIATLVEYMQEYAEYLVVALLPEDAAALDDTCQYVTEI